MRHLAPTLFIALALTACDEKPQGEAAPRFQGVSKKKQPAKAPSFCERSWEPEGAPAFALPTLRALPGQKTPPRQEKAKGWRWINAWATWCGPCVAEMGLLSTWHSAFDADGLSVRFELLSIDEPEAEADLGKWLTRPLPGGVLWIEDSQAFGPWMKGLSLDPGSPIPVHLLVDASDRLRCARVGAIHEQDFGAVKAFLSGG